jgi:hypothetical protein
VRVDANGCEYAVLAFSYLNGPHASFQIYAGNNQACNSRLLGTIQNLI